MLFIFSAHLKDWRHPDTFNTSTGAVSPTSKSTELENSLKLSRLRQKSVKISFKSKTEGRPIPLKGGQTCFLVILL
jgi:hypothetical protein